MAILLVAVCAVSLWARFARLMSTRQQRVSVAVGIGFGAIIGLAQGFVKHVGEPWVALLVADVYIALLVSTIGIGSALRTAAASAAQGRKDQLPKRTTNRMAVIILIVAFALVALEAVAFRA